MATPTKRDERCGLLCVAPQFCQRLASVQLFVLVMCLVIGVQGCYLGYMVAVLTSIERRFEIPSSKSGLLLSVYDVGHTLAVLLVGHFASNRNKPKWTAIGVLLSAIAMFGLFLPNLIWGRETSQEQHLSDHRTYERDAKCDRNRNLADDDSSSCNRNENAGAYAILMVSQLIAGIAAAPFNTLAYVYIDDNVSNRQSPFYLGLLTSMYAFGPAFGFGLGALCTSVYTEPGNAPTDIDPTSPSWIGAWWLGFLVCGFLYLLLVVPTFMFPHRMPKKGLLAEEVNNGVVAFELEDLRPRSETKDDQPESCTNLCVEVIQAVKAFPLAVWYLLKNPVYSSMVLAWIFGSYLVGGFGTYLPKYFETQYGRTASIASVYAGVISIGSIALSTAVGGYLLTRFNIKPRKATLFLMLSWLAIFITYIIALFIGCKQPQLQGEQTSKTQWNFIYPCNEKCNCDNVQKFDPVCSKGVSYFSPCHAGCTTYAYNQWSNCNCVGGPNVGVTSGLCDAGCGWLVYAYAVLMFVGLFVGNLFFMTTMMVVLRCVQDEYKALALSFASCVTNVLGFIPSPIIFGALIDTACVSWHLSSVCDDGARGNCLLYDNADFRLKYHLGNAGFQLLAVGAVLATYIIARRFRFPEEEIDDDDEDPDSPPSFADDN